MSQSATRDALYITTGQIDPTAIVALLRPALPDRADVLVGASEPPSGGDGVVRPLGPTSQAVRAALRTAWNAARIAVLGASAPDLRKG